MPTKRKPAKKPAKVKQRVPARWFLDTGKDQANDLVRRGRLEKGSYEYNHYLARKRAATKIYLHDAVKELRQYFTGFDAKDGYRLDDISSMSAQKMKQVRMYASHLHSIKAHGTVRVVPKSKKQKAALEKYTSQIYTGKKQARAYAVAVDHPDRSEVDIVNGKVRVTEKFKGGKTVQQLYDFADYDVNTTSTWSAFINSLKKMLKDLPEGSYTLMSAVHGPIFLPMPKRDIILNLNYRFKSYDKEMIPTLYALRWFKTELSAEREYIDRSKRRRGWDNQKRDNYNAMNRRVTASLRKGRGKRK